MREAAGGFTPACEPARSSSTPSNAPSPSLLGTGLQRNCHAGAATAGLANPTNDAADRKSTFRRPIAGEFIGLLRLRAMDPLRRKPRWHHTIGLPEVSTVPGVFPDAIRDAVA
ncbi:hypothetical protein [Kibdelosporangium philippinense]|uniref:hypothetical protein n=1 Tax=Kibdelosporangium philippinense TaxID=211113 RepID=UPI00360A1C2D